MAIGYYDVHDRSLGPGIMKKEVPTIATLVSNPYEPIYGIDLVGKDIYGNDIYVDVEVAYPWHPMWRNDGNGLTTVVSKFKKYAKTYGKNYYIVYLMRDVKDNYLGNYLIINGAVLLEKAVQKTIIYDSVKTETGKTEVYKLRHCIPGVDYITNVKSLSSIITTMATAIATSMRNSTSTSTSTNTSTSTTMKDNTTMNTKNSTTMNTKNSTKTIMLNNTTMNVIGTISKYSGSALKWNGNLSANKKLLRPGHCSPNDVIEFYEHDIATGKPKPNTTNYIKATDFHEVFLWCVKDDELNSEGRGWTRVRTDYVLAPYSKLIEWQIKEA